MPGFAAVWLIIASVALVWLIKVVNHLGKEIEKMTTAVDNLNAAVAALGAAIDTAVTDFTTLLAELQAAITNGDDAAVQAAADAITTKVATLSAAAAVAVPPTP